MEESDMRDVEFYYAGAMKDRCGLPIVTLNVPLIRRESSEKSFKLSVTFEAALDLADIYTYQSGEALYQHLSACLFKHISDWYWSARK